MIKLADIRRGLCAALCVLAAPSAAAGAPPKVTGTIPFPGGEPLGLAVHQGTNRLFVTEDNARSLYVFDGATRRQLAKIPIGGGAFEIVVNETFGKVYAASEAGCCTTGISPGTGNISVVDVRSNQLLTTIDPGPEPEDDPSEFVLANDEVHDKVYVAWEQGIGVIDVATDQFTLLQNRQFEVAVGTGPWAINTVTNKAYIPFFGGNQILSIDGATGQITSLPLRGSGPLDLEVNERENKLYVAMVRQPGKPSPGILILDRDTGSTRFVGNDDLQPLVFSNRSNRLFSGVQVGERGAIVDGRTNRFRSIDLKGDGMGAGAVRASTDNAYFANDHSTFVVNGKSRCTTRLKNTKPSEGGLVQTAVAINQATGRVYVSNRQGAHKVTVIRDGRVPCRRRRR